MSISFTEDMLKEAVIKADIYEIETLSTDDEIEYEFSNEFKRKMKKLIRQSKTKKPGWSNGFFCVGVRSLLLLQSLSCLRPQ